MAFQEIESVSDINSGYRVILYYIEHKQNESNLNVTKLQETLEAAMRTLQKKNDDVLMVKVASDSEHFIKFQQLYKPDIKGQATLFVVNNEGIPIVSQHIFEERNISAAILTICNCCALNTIPSLDSDVKADSNLSSSVTHDHNTIKESTSAQTLPQTVLSSVEKNIPIGPNGSILLESLSQNKNCSVNSQPSSTQLQIRLPDGSRHKQQFDKEAALNEVWVFISTQYKIKDFDLKTYNHQNFSEEEYESTLKDLDLYPNGVVIVVPKLGVSINDNGWIRSLIRYSFYQFVSKTTSAYSYIQGLLIMVWNSLFFSNRPRGDSNPRRKQIQPTQNSNSDQSSYQRRSKSSTTSFGNIHTLKRNDDSDDENNRYNGNSTQQK